MNIDFNYMCQEKADEKRRNKRSCDHTLRVAQYSSASNKRIGGLLVNHSELSIGSYVGLRRIDADENTA